ncbi:MAG: hypothetical protein ABR95_09990 [Sphingobacteriales bacterium BACL12 MAG-120813-bin55]|jgi:hypothetical protein|nr:MAG: hypothetical protein ABR94_02975 [Sphingobacteriales bacterium BACL12 MAG-120802-bin5]KRP11614.1 MAG: hypothetical protein ABR95_09990 [Sphingobacteriales bacterium BACL12 MAG-120813-bin55]
MNKNLITAVIKVAILALLSWALYEQLVVSDRLSDVYLKLKGSLNTRGWWLLVFCVVLMFFNWGTEALKWKLLIQPLLPIRFFRAFKAVWTGVTLGLFTPNRIGEYGGRLLYIPMRFRLSGVVSSLIGSYAQILATLLVGIIGLLSFTSEHLDIGTPVFTAIVFIGLLLLVLLVLGYYNLGVFITAMGHKRVFRKIMPYISVLDKYHNRDFTRIWMLSVLRFLIFSAQYLIFLRLFGVEIQLMEGMTAIGVIFLAQTILPSFTVAELFTRGNISLYFLGFYTDNSGAVLAASTSLWLLNLIIPATLGYLFILRKNFFKNKRST